MDRVIQLKKSKRINLRIDKETYNKLIQIKKTTISKLIREIIKTSLKKDLNKTTI